MDDGIAAVKRQFPLKAQAIDERASWDAVFREICRDFSEAQTELMKWKSSSDADQARRCEEYRELLEGLGEEIEQVLHNASMVQLHPPPFKRPT
jgi:DNA mismatch repair ATPase MutL